ncbi:MAG: tetratricopeptide repeat protein [Ferruginibacter sp.]
MNAALLKTFKIGVFVLFFLCKNSFAQNVPDSLLQQLKATTGDSAKARILLQMGESIEIEAPEKSMEFYNTALLTARKIKNIECLFFTYINIGNCYIELNKMDSAVAAFEQAISAARLLKDSVKVGRAFGNLGNVYLHKNDRDKALQHYLYAARLWENSSEQKYLPTAYNNINALLEEQSESAQAADFANKAIAIATKLGDTLSWVDGLVNLSVSYNSLQQYDKAYQLLMQALPLAKSSGDAYQLVTIYNNMGDYFMTKGNYNAALDKYEIMYKYTKQMGNKYYIGSATLALAQANRKLKNYKQAHYYIVEAEALATAVGERAELKDVYNIRAKIEQDLGNYKLAGEYYAKTLTLSDSLFKASTSEKVAEAEAKYQNERKEKEIIQLQKDKEIQSLSLKQKSTLNYILLGSLTALLIVGLLGYRNIRHRQQLAKQQDELQQRRISELEKDKQLVAVDAMIKGQEEERSRLAKDLHDGLGGLLSGVKFSISNMKDNLIMTPDNLAVFERSLDMLDTSIRELRRVAHNMMPEMLSKFGLDEALKEYCNSINATKLVVVKYQSHGMTTRLEMAVEIVIYRIIQELLNNSLKHAAATETFVQLIREGNRLNVVVEDNGKGFNVNAPENNRGAGLANVRSRVDYLKGQLDIHAEDGKGTLINIEFNI